MWHSSIKVPFEMGSKWIQFMFVLRKLRRLDKWRSRTYWYVTSHSDICNVLGMLIHVYVFKALYGKMGLKWKCGKNCCFCCSSGSIYGPPLHNWNFLDIVVGSWLCNLGQLLHLGQIGMYCIHTMHYLLNYA